MRNNFFKDVATSISDKCKQAHQNYQKQQQQICLQNKNQYIYNLMYALQKDLFEAMGNRHYSKLVNIAHPSYIRIHNWQTAPDGTVLYQYALDKELGTDDSMGFMRKIPAIILSHIQKNINLDITNKQNELRSIYPLESIYMNFPFLYSGIQITSVRDIGTSVILEVASNIQPS